MKRSEKYKEMPTVAEVLKSQRIKIKKLQTENRLMRVIIKDWIKKHGVKS